MKKIRPKERAIWKKLKLGSSRKIERRTKRKKRKGRRRSAKS
jgi:hypothetical protein